MHFKSAGPSGGVPEGAVSGLSRRAALALAAGGLATFASGNQGLQGLLRPGPRVHWDELAIANPVAFTVTVPRRLSHPASHEAAALADWAVFKRRFLAGDGRICDTGNGGVSHSEGQGWGMLLAVAFDDMASFDLIRDWTQRNLQCRSDALHAWRFVPQSPVPVADRNNASDGDLFIAAALWRAAWRWRRQELVAPARDIAGDILGTLVRDVGGRTVLLPGAVGFERPRTVVVNPSYYILPVFEELAALLPSPSWQKLRTHGLELLRDGRFGPWRLPPDWLQVDRGTGMLSPDPQRPARFSYDAIRVPLWLAWEKCGEAPLRDFLTYWRRYQPNPPAWVDLATNQMAAYPAPSGMLAIGRIAGALSNADENSLSAGGLPVLSASIDYYSAALTLLSRCVWQESRDA
jgi:endo-1,4-beta-D-glucanase Y